jgi:hypothetical protein
LPGLGVPPQWREIVWVFSSQRSPQRPPIKHFNLSTVAEKLTTLEAGIQKVGAKILISGRIKTLGSQSHLWANNSLFGLFFKNIIYI